MIFEKQLKGSSCFDVSSKIWQCLTKNNTKYGKISSYPHSYPPIVDNFFVNLWTFTIKFWYNLLNFSK